MSSIDVIYYEYLYMSLIDQIYYEYLYMSLIDLIYYVYLYMSLIDLIYYLNVNFYFCIITNKLHNINKTINNNLVIVHTKQNLSIPVYLLFTLIY